MQQLWKKNLFDPLCFLTPAPTFFKKPISTSFSTIRLKFSLIYVFKRRMMAVKGVREKPARPPTLFKKRFHKREPELGCPPSDGS
jgi:hypothetical protein